MLLCTENTLLGVIFSVFEQVFEEINQLRNIVDLNSLITPEHFTTPSVVVLNQLFVLGILLIN